MTELWVEPEQRFQRLVDTLWHIAEQESDGDHIQAEMHDLAKLYKWCGEVLRSRDRDLTPADTRVSFELAQEYGHWIPEREQ